jgi:hypothetical protein
MTPLTRRYAWRLIAFLNDNISEILELEKARREQAPDLGGRGREAAASEARTEANRRAFHRLEATRHAVALFVDGWRQVATEDRELVLSLLTIDPRDTSAAVPAELVASLVRALERVHADAPIRETPKAPRPFTLCNDCVSQLIAWRAVPADERLCIGKLIRGEVGARPSSVAFVHYNLADSLLDHIAHCQAFNAPTTH